MDPSLRLRVGEFATVLAGVVLGVVGLFTSGNVALIILSAGLVVIALASLTGSALLVVAHEREKRAARANARWSRAMRHVSDIALTIADIRASESADGETPLVRAGKACAALGTAFTAVTGSQCRVSVKELYVAEGLGNEPAVRTLVYPTTLSSPDPRDADLVRDNTDFAEIVEGATNFFSNDLVADIQSGYRNSHWTSAKMREWTANGEYPYRSTIVLPVNARVENGVTSQGPFDTVGFLCVDSVDADVFDRAHDLAVAEIIARMLYIVWPLLTAPTSPRTD